MSKLVILSRFTLHQCIKRFNKNHLHKYIDNFSKNFPAGILKKFFWIGFWILIVRIISEFWAQESLSKSQKNIFVCTTYVVQYTTFVGQSYHICGILYHKRGILYHKREFPGNPYTVKQSFAPFTRPWWSDSICYVPIIILFINYMKKY